MRPQRRGTLSLAGGHNHEMGLGDPESRRLERRWAPRYTFRAGLEI